MILQYSGIWKVGSEHVVASSRALGYANIKRRVIQITRIICFQCLDLQGALMAILIQVCKT